MPVTKLVNLRKHRARNININAVSVTELVTMLATRSVEEVARKIRVHPSTIRTRLKRHGVTVGETRPDDGKTARQRIREREGVV